MIFTSPASDFLGKILRKIKRRFKIKCVLACYNQISLPLGQNVRNEKALGIIRLDLQAPLGKASWKASRSGRTKSTHSKLPLVLVCGWMGTNQLHCLFGLASFLKREKKPLLTEGEHKSVATLVCWWQGTELVQSKPKPADLPAFQMREGTSRRVCSCYTHGRDQMNHTHSY